MAFDVRYFDKGFLTEFANFLIGFEAKEKTMLLTEADNIIVMEEVSLDMELEEEST